MKKAISSKVIGMVKILAKENADNILKTEPVSHKENIDYSNIKKGQYVAKIQDNVAIPVCDNFSQGGYVKKGECSLIGVVAPAEHYFIGNKIDNSTLEKINNLSEKMNTTINVLSGSKRTKAGDLK